MGFSSFLQVISRKEDNLTMMRNYFGDRLTESNVQEPLAKQPVVSSAPAAEADTITYWYAE